MVTMAGLDADAMLSAGSTAHPQRMRRV